MEPQGDILTWKSRWGALSEDLSELSCFSPRIGANLALLKFFSAVVDTDQ